jgi:hypothetical protein
MIINCIKDFLYFAHMHTGIFGPLVICLMVGGSILMAFSGNLIGKIGLSMLLAGFIFITCMLFY